MVPIIFHNMRGYDGHLIMKGYKNEIFPHENIQCIPNNMEKYISFTIGNLRFIDSFQFMAESLDKLSSNLKGIICAHFQAIFIRKITTTILKMSVPVRVLGFNQSIR